MCGPSLDPPIVVDASASRAPRESVDRGSVAGGLRVPRGGAALPRAGLGPAPAHATALALRLLLARGLRVVDDFGGLLFGIADGGLFGVFHLRSLPVRRTPRTCPGRSSGPL